jgi:hypothetical protein
MSYYDVKEESRGSVWLAGFPPRATQHIREQIGHTRLENFCLQLNSKHSSVISRNAHVNLNNSKAREHTF